MATPLLDLLQLTDSTFPSGAYAHSLGLETMYGWGPVDLEGQMRFLLWNTLARVELPVVRAAYQMVDPAELDALMDVLVPVAELRQASRAIGRGFLRATTGLRPLETPAEHHAVVFGVVLRGWGIALQDGLDVYAFQAVRQQLSAAQRLGKIGQSTLHDLLDRLKPAVSAAVAESLTVGLDEMGGFAPLLDLAAMAHAQQHARLFQS